MAENLVIVESPAKAKTIKKYLGTGFEVLASYGHIRDLVPKEGAVDTAHGFAKNIAVIAMAKLRIWRQRQAECNQFLIPKGVLHL